MDRADAGGHAIDWQAFVDALQVFALVVTETATRLDAHDQPDDVRELLGAATRLLDAARRVFPDNSGHSTIRSSCPMSR